MKAPRLKDTMRATVLAMALGVAGAAGPAEPVSRMDPESVEPWGDDASSSSSIPGAGESRCSTVDIRFRTFRCTCASERREETS